MKVKILDKVYSTKNLHVKMCEFYLMTIPTLLKYKKSNNGRKKLYKAMLEYYYETHTDEFVVVN